LSSTPIAAGQKKQNPEKRYRLPGITREGIGQLSLLETALWPLQGGLKATTFGTTFSFNSAGEQRQGNVTVYAPLGVQPVDEYVLWGLLGVSLSRKPADRTLLMTPYWLMKRLGLATGGSQYEQLRKSLERLAAIAYQNTAFYNPVTQQHERVTLHFFSTYLPTSGRGGLVDVQRVWRIEWSPMFFQMCQATGGTLLFDLDLYRQLTPAARRLFLKLKDRFWRSKRVFMNVDDLTINGLGFSAQRPLKKRKYDLISCMRELLDLQIIELGRGQTEPQQLFLRRSKGVYVVQFFEGDYFRQPMAPRTVTQQRGITDDPLYEPLRTIGVDEGGIRRLFKQHSRRLIEQWIRVTDVAMHDRPRGFPGFKVSPAAFLINALDNGRLPPDWIYAHEKERKREQWEQERAATAASEEVLRMQYEQERAAALREYLAMGEGRAQFQKYLPFFLDFYQKVEPDRYHETAHEKAAAKVDREHFQFPAFGIWLLEHHTTTI